MFLQIPEVYYSRFGITCLVVALITLASHIYRRIKSKEESYFHKNSGTVYKYPLFDDFKPHSYAVFGSKVTDQYSVFETTSRVRSEWIEKQKCCTSSYFSNLRIFKELFRVSYTRLSSQKTDFSIPYKYGKYYFFFKKIRMTDNFSLFKSVTADQQFGDDLVVDGRLPNDGITSLYKNQTKMSMNHLWISHDGKDVIYAHYDDSKNNYLMFSSKKEEKWLKLRIRNIETKEDYPEILCGCDSDSLDVTWSQDGIGFFYIRSERNYGLTAYLDSEQSSNLIHSIYYHRVATSQSMDLRIYKNEEHLNLYYSLSLSVDNKLLFINIYNKNNNKGSHQRSTSTTTNQVYYINLTSFDALEESESQTTTDLLCIPFISSYQHRFVYIYNEMNIYYFYTNYQANNYCIIAYHFQLDDSDVVSLPWEIIVSEKSDAKLINVQMVTNKVFLLQYLKNGCHELYLFDLNGVKSSMISPHFLDSNEISSSDDYENYSLLQSKTTYGRYQSPEQKRRQQQKQQQQHLRRQQSTDLIPLFVLPYCAISDISCNINSNEIFFYRKHFIGPEAIYWAVLGRNSESKLEVLLEELSSHDGDYPRRNNDNSSNNNRNYIYNYEASSSPDIDHHHQNTERVNRPKDKSHDYDVRFIECPRQDGGRPIDIFLCGRRIIIYNSLDLNLRVPMSRNNSSNNNKSLAMRRSLLRKNSSSLSPLHCPRPCILYVFEGDIESESYVVPHFSLGRYIFIRHFGGFIAMIGVNAEEIGREGGSARQAGLSADHLEKGVKDIIDTAEFLIRCGLTYSDQIALHGGGYCGALIGIAINQRPDLFGAVVIQAGIFDLLRFPHFESTRHLIEVFGDPAESIETFEKLKKISPHHNIGEKIATSYPAVLITSMESDAVISPIHSYKFLSTLQHTLGVQRNQEKPFLLRIERKFTVEDMVHADSFAQRALDEQADIYSFIGKNIGAEWSE